MEWIVSTMNAIRAEFEVYKRRYSDEVLLPPIKEPDYIAMDEFEAYNYVTDDYAALDDLERYMREPLERDRTISPLKWWQLNQHRYSILSRMALDLLAAPASSAVDERDISKAGHVVNEERWHTSDELAEGYQCLKGNLKKICLALATSVSYSGGGEVYILITLSASSLRDLRANKQANEHDYYTSRANEPFTSTERTSIGQCSAH